LLPIIISFLDHLQSSWQYANYHTYMHLEPTPLRYNYLGIPVAWKHYKSHQKQQSIANYRKPRTIASSPSAEHTYYGGVFKILMLGKDGVGKSSLTIRFVANQYSEQTDATIDDNWEKLCSLNVAKHEYDTYQDIKFADLQCHQEGNKYSRGRSILADDEGEEEEDEEDEADMDEQEAMQYNRYQIADVSCDYEWGFPRMAHEYYKEAQIFLLVFDIMKHDTFERIQIYREAIIRARGDIANDRYLMVVVGNKCDLRDDYQFRRNNETQCCRMEQVLQWVEDNQLPYIETSAKENKNVHLLFRQCIYEYWICSIAK